MFNQQNDPSSINMKQISDDQQMQSDGDQSSYVDSYQPPSEQLAMKQTGDISLDDLSDRSETDQQPMVTNEQQSAASDSPVAGNTVTQALEDQNIFFLLGAEDGTAEEKEAFLDELQQVIWEDFIENDVELLLTEEEVVELEKIMNKKSGSEEEIQEEMVVYLEKIVPDLEEIMLEKALELKEDMVRERLAGMREYYEAESEKLQELDTAQQLMDDGLWRDAAQKLNQLQPSAQ